MSLSLLGFLRPFTRRLETLSGDFGGSTLVVLLLLIISLELPSLFGNESLSAPNVILLLILSMGVLLILVLVSFLVLFSE